MSPDIVCRGEQKRPINGDKDGSSIRWGRYSGNEPEGEMSGIARNVIKAAYKGQVAGSVWKDMHLAQSGNADHIKKKKEFDHAIATYIAR